MHRFTDRMVTNAAQITKTVSSPQTCPTGVGTEGIDDDYSGSSFGYDQDTLEWLWKAPKPIPNPSKPCYKLTVRATADTGPGLSVWVKLRP